MKYRSVRPFLYRAVMFMTALSLVSALLLTPAGQAQAAGPGEITASSALLMDMETGRVLFDQNGHTPAYPASTTKIMTALLAIEYLDMDQRIEVPEDMGPADGAAMYLLPGEAFTVRQLVDSLMVKSANDAAVLLARTISGSVEAFADLMNHRARELGARNTHFTNPNGLPDDNHVTTAYDLAVISRHAMTDPLFREIAEQVRVTLDETEQTPEKRYFRTSNRFRWSQALISYRGSLVPIQYDVVDGIKTGWTRQANQCLVSSGEISGVRMIAVVLGAEGYNVYSDSRALLDYGFEHFEPYTLLEANAVLGELELPEAGGDTVLYGVREDVTALRHRSDPSFFQYDTVVDLHEPELPVRLGQVLGTVEVVDGEYSQILNIHALSEAQPLYAMVTASSSVGNIGLRLLLWALAGMAGLAVLFVFWVAWNMKKSGKRYRFRGLKKRTPVRRNRTLR